MKLTRHNFGELLTPIHEKIFWDTYKKLEQEYTKVAYVFDMNKKEATFPHMGAFGMWQENNEGNTINEDEINQGPVAKLEAVRYDKGYSITWELVRDDLYNVMKGIGKGGGAAGLADGINKTIEHKVASVFNNAFTNVGFDGVSLISASHPLTDSSAAGDNLVTGVLDPANLKKAMTKMRLQKNAANELVGLNARELIVGPENEFTALEILHSTQVAYTDQNTKNVITGLKPVVLSRINDTQWFVRDNSLQQVAVGWRDKPTFDSEKIPKTVDQFCYGVARAAVGYIDWMGLVGSTGK